MNDYTCETEPTKLDQLHLEKIHREFLMLEMTSWDAYKVAAQSVGITENELWILLEVSESDPMPCQADIARNLRLPKQTVNSALDKMARKGWLELVALPNNRKSKGVVLTEAGHESLDPFLKEIHQAECDAIGSLGDEQLRVMMEAIRDYTRALEENLNNRFRKEKHNP